MKIIKIILYYLLLASTLYAGVGIISPLYETGWHFFACIYVLGCLFSAVYRKRFVATS